MITRSRFKKVATMISDDSEDLLCSYYPLCYCASCRPSSLEGVQVLSGTRTHSHVVARVLRTPVNAAQVLLYRSISDISVSLALSMGV